MAILLAGCRQWAPMLATWATQRVIQAGKHARDSHTDSHGYMLPLTKWGLQLLRQHCFAAIPTDKDGGFALVHKDCLHEIHETILSSSLYEEINPSCINHPTQFETHTKLAWRIENFQKEPGLAKTILKWTGPKATLAAKLLTTCKSH